MHFQYDQTLTLQFILIFQNEIKLHTTDLHLNLILFCLFSFHWTSKCQEEILFLFYAERLLHVKEYFDQVPFIWVLKSTRKKMKKQKKIMVRKGKLDIEAINLHYRVQWYFECYWISIGWSIYCYWILYFKGESHHKYSDILFETNYIAVCTISFILISTSQTSYCLCVIYT